MLRIIIEFWSNRLYFLPFFQFGRNLVVYIFLKRLTLGKKYNNPNTIMAAYVELIFL